MNKPISAASVVIPCLVKLAAASRGDVFEALQLANRFDMPDPVCRILQKASQVGGSLSDPAFMANLVEGGAASVSYIESLRNVSAFAGMLDSFRRAPLRTRFSVSLFNVLGDTIPEGSAVPLSRLEIDNLILPSRKAAVLLVMSRELAMMMSSAAQALIASELRSGLGFSIDTAFFECVSEGTGMAIITSGGTTAVDAGSDLRQLLDAVDVHADSKLFFVAAPDTAKRAATLQTSDGAFVFGGMGAMGGEMLAVETLVSDAVEAGALYLIDASQFGADLEGVTIDVSASAALQMDTTPSASATAQVSMFQTNSIATKAVAWFGCQKLGQNAAAKLESITWGGVVT